MKKFNLKNVAVEILKLAVMLVIVANIVSYLKRPEIVDNTLPTLQAKLIDGNSTSLEALAGKPVILYFWGTWCPICKMSSPVISGLSRDYQVITVAVNSGSDADIKSYLKAHNLHFPVINDAEGDIARSFGVDTFPTTFLYNDKGKLFYTDVGYTSKPSLILKLWIGNLL